MKKALTKNQNKLYYYKAGIEKIVDYKDKKTYPENISGNISKLSGNVTGIKGNLYDCEITDKDRKKGIDIQNLIK